MRSVRSWLGLICATLSLLPGCGGNSDKRPLVAFVSNNSESFWTIAEKGCQQAAKDNDVRAEVRMPSPGTAEVQRQIVQDLLNKGVKGIAVSANAPQNTVGFFKNEVARKVPLIMQDNDLPDPTARRCYIGTNNYLAGRAAGELVTKAVPQGGKIGIFVGQMDAQNAIERRQGVLDYLMNPKSDQKQLGDVTPSDATDLKLGDKYVLVTTKTDEVSAEKCQDHARQLLLQHPDVVCLVGLWAYNPPALLRAARKAKQQDAKVKAIVVGFDEEYETLDGVRDGEVYATVVQNPYEFGYQSIKILAGLARGDESVLKNRKDMDDQGRIFIPHRIITKDNVAEFKTQLQQLKGK
jgi:ribose transport system substrate-binding protein